MSPADAFNHSWKMMRFVLISWLSLVWLESLRGVQSQQDVPLWTGGQALPKELFKPPSFLLETAAASDESSDYDALKKRVVRHMGVDLPDYILARAMQPRTKPIDLESIRKQMQISGKR